MAGSLMVTDAGGDSSVSNNDTLGMPSAPFFFLDRLPEGDCAYELDLSGVLLGEVRLDDSLVALGDLAEALGELCDFLGALLGVLGSSVDSLGVASEPSVAPPRPILRGETELARLLSPAGLAGD